MANKTFTKQELIDLMNDGYVIMNKNSNSCCYKHNTEGFVYLHNYEIVDEWRMFAIADLKKNYKRITKTMYELERLIYGK